jgi:hypothetical protein
MKLAGIFFFAALASGCGARTSISGSPPSAACSAAPPICVQSASDPCGTPTTVDAVCDDGSHAWTCPAGARVYARAADPAATCLPFRATPGLGAVGGWGLSAMTRVPTDDGRCLWIADSATLSDGTVARNVAFTADTTAPFGTCPEASAMPPTPIVTLEGGDDPSILVQIDGGYRLAGETHVLYRLFRVDPSATFGAVELGGGVGRWDPDTQRIVVPGPASFPWGLDLDLGDAYFVADDGRALVWGCAQPGQFLLRGCELARLDENDGVELFSKGGAWLATTDASQGATLFGAGAWTSSVVAGPDGFRHLYVADFGDRIQSHVASDLTGPWSDGPDVAACDLPSSDPKAFCAGPIVHAELADPTRPSELPVTYGVGTTGAATGNADDYWTRLVFAP